MPDPDDTLHEAACHCGTVRLRLRLPDGLASARRCSCSYCRMRGAVTLSLRAGDMEIAQGAENLTRYRFHTGVAEHYFCRTCGIHTHHRRRSDPDLFGLNAACLTGVSPFDFADLPVTDGTNHPADTGSPARLAGRLRFEPAV